jgi:Zn-dependent metalloprotease
MADIRDNSQYIVHFMNEHHFVDDQINVANDTLVIYTDNDGNHRSVKMLPFDLNNQDKQNLTFAEKVDFFKQKVISFYGNKLINEIESDSSVTTFNVDYGTILEFQNAFASPVDMGLTFDEFFSKIYADMDLDNLAEFNTGLSEVI